MKKRYVISIITILLITLSFFAYNKYSSKQEIISNKGIAIYLQDENNENNYVLSELNTIPTEGYTFNVEKTNSLCNDAIFSYDSTNNKVSVSTSKSIQCNLYFDIYSYNISPNTVVVDTGAVGETSYTPACNGKYKLEVWGAQGGSYEEYHGGYGGYSVGVVNLEDTDTLYINVGGEGTIAHEPNTIVLGGYNGGGTGFAKDSRANVQAIVYEGSGGGLTHIATVTKSNESGKTGELKYLEEYKGILTNNSYYVSDKILIVAGGGGGADYYVVNQRHNGANAGGYIGNNVSYTMPSNAVLRTSGGNQTTGGHYYEIINNTEQNQRMYGAFGRGNTLSYKNDTTTEAWAAGGGGGFYGGGGGYGSATGGSGGSGYIASSRLISSNGIEKSMYCLDCETSANTETKTYQSNTYCTNGYSESAIEKCAKAGNGYARITYLGK